MSTYIISGILLILMILAIRSIVKSKKEGSSCGCGCSGCTAQCHNQKDK